MTRYLSLPSGPYGVSWMEVLTRGHSPNSVHASLFYPTDQKDNVELHGDEWPLWINQAESDRVYQHLSEVFGCSQCCYRNSFGYLTSDVRIPCRVGQPLSVALSSFPVLNFSHGLMGSHKTYCVILMELASWGFIVLACSHRDGSSFIAVETDDHGEVRPVPFIIKEGAATKVSDLTKFEENDELRLKQLETRVREMNTLWEFCTRLNSGIPDATSVIGPQQPTLLEMFYEKLDLRKLFLMGHSFGGATALKMLTSGESASRYQATILLDAWMFPFKRDPTELKKVQAPCFYVNEEQMWVRKMYDVLRYAVNDKAEFVMIKGANHDHVTDIPSAIGRGCLASLARLVFTMGRSKMGYETTMKVNNALTLKYLKEHLMEAVPQTTQETIEAHEQSLIRGFEQAVKDYDDQQASSCSVL